MTVLTEGRRLLRTSVFSKWAALGFVGMCTVVPRISFAAPKWGNPDQHALVALRCDVGVVDRSLSGGAVSGLAKKLFGMGDSPEWMETRPYLARVDGGSKAIMAKKKGDVFVFAALEPGKYRIDRIDGATMRSRLPGEGDRNDIELLSYGPGSDAPPELTVDVRAGDVVYLGDLELVDNSYPRDGVRAGDYPPVSHKLRRSSKDAVDALRILRKAQKDTAWAPIMDRQIESLDHAAASDTTLTW